MIQAKCFLPLNFMVKQAATSLSKKVSRCQMEDIGTARTRPTPSHGSYSSETKTAFDMLIMRAFLCQARKKESSLQDIYQYVRKRCDFSECTLQRKIKSSLSRLLRRGFITLHNIQRFKLSARGKSTRCTGTKKSKSVGRFSSRWRSKSRSRPSCKKKKRNGYKNPCKKHKRSHSQRGTEGRSRPRTKTKSRSKSRCRSKPRKPKNANIRLGSKSNPKRS